MKRFTDTDIWNKPWFRKLTPEMKEAWRFIIDHCDNVGVWVPDYEAAEFYIGGEVDWESLSESCNGNIEVLPCGKWWVVDLVRFQHADLFADYEASGKTPSKPCESYVKLLRHHGLYDRFPELFKAFGKPLESLAKGYKDKERVKDKEKEKEPKKKYAEYVTMTEAEYGKLVEKYGEAQTQKLIDKLNAYKGSKGKTYKSDYLTMFGWVIDAVKPVERGKVLGVCEVCGENFDGGGKRCPRCK